MTEQSYGTRRGKSINAVDVQVGDGESVAVECGAERILP